MCSNKECTYRIPGEYVFEGITCGGFHKKETLMKMREGIAPKADILVATPQRAGTARLVEIVWLLTHECNINAAQEREMSNRHIFYDLLPPDFQMDAEKPHLLESPPVIAKTHFPPSFLPTLFDDKKVVVGFRNPKDNLVSQYYFYKMNEVFGLFTGSWDEFFDIYMQGRISYGCPMDMMLEWWKLRDQDNVLIVKYEDFEKKGAENMVKLISEFLGYDYNTETLKAVVDRVSFSSMKSNPNTNYSSAKALKAEISPYMRKGTVGDWKNYFNEEQNAYVDKLYHEKCVPADLIFQFE